MRQVIGGERHPPTPAVLPLRRTHLGEEAHRRRLEPREEGGIAAVVQRTAPAHEETALWIETEVEEDAPQIRHDVARGEHAPPHVLGQRPRGDLVALHGQHGALEPRPQIVRIGIGGQDDRARRHAPRARDRPPGARVGVQLSRRGAPVDGCARLPGRPREATHIGERLERARAAVEHAAHIARGPRQLRDLLPIQQLDGRATPLPLLGSRPQARQGRFVRGGANPAAGLSMAGDLVARDELEDEVGGAAGDLPHAPPRLRAELVLELVRLVLEAGDDLAAVPP